MQIIRVAKFKSELSSILEKVQNDGEKYIIEYGKKHKKIAMLIPYEENKKQRTFGIYEGQAFIPENFNYEDNTINELFYDGSINP